MNNYLTSTYTKDFTWPTFYASNKKTIENYDLEAIKEENKTKNACYQLSLKEKNKKGTEETVGKAASPVGLVSTFDKPDTFLKKLYEKYPYIYNVLKMTNEEQLIKKVEEGKFRTTYQADFGKEGQIPRDNFEELMDIAAAVKESEKEKCKTKVCTSDGTDVCPCHASLQPCKCGEAQTGVVKKAMKFTEISKLTGTREKRKKDKCKKEFQRKGKPPDFKKAKSEYSDTISKLGKIIIKEKLHSRTEQ